MANKRKRKRAPYKWAPGKSTRWLIVMSTNFQQRFQMVAQPTNSGDDDATRTNEEKKETKTLDFRNSLMNLCAHLKYDSRRTIM